MKILGIEILTHKNYMNSLEGHYQTGLYYGIEQGYTLKELEEAKQQSYNEGKQEGIAIAKRAFAKALKQKGESNNDILRQHQRG